MILSDLLTEDGFEVEIAYSPKQGEDMTSYNPDFELYDVVIMDYNGDLWCQEMRDSFVDYLQDGGGLVLYHAANTTFRVWEEFDKIIGLGAFGGRGEQTEGYYTEWKDGQMIKYEDQGVVGHHGARHDFTIVCRNPDHPAVDPTLPLEAHQPFDEIYDRTKGPANIKDVLYTAYSETQTGGTGKEEIVIFTVDYGKARIFNSMIGHAASDNPEECAAMHSEAFTKSFLAGARWAAGKQ